MTSKLFKAKKGIVFTILALVISAFILAMFYYILEVPVDHNVDLTRTKVNNVNTILIQSENFAKAQAIASSRQAINNMINASYVTDTPIVNFDNSFYACLTTGNFTHIGVVRQCGEASNLKRIIENNLSNFFKEEMDLDVEFIVEDMALGQLTHWELIIYFNLTMHIEDEYFSWNVHSSLNESFSIVGLKDPIPAATGWGPSLSMYRPPFDDLGISFHPNYRNISNWNEKHSTLNMLAKEGYYFEYVRAPSYLDRLKNNLDRIDYPLGIVSVTLPIYTIPGDYNSIVGSGSSNLDWTFWRDFVDVVPTGSYDFSLVEDIISVLDVTYPYDLNNTLHKARIPRDLAIKANVSGSTYFS